MRKLMLFGLVLLSLSCSDKIKVSGHRTEELRQISGYNKIELSDGVRAVIRYAETEGVVVKTFSSVQEYVKTYVSDGTLYVEIENDKQFSEEPNVIVTVSAHAIKALTLSGGVSAKSEEKAFTDVNDVVFHLSGGSSYSGELSTNQFTVELSGGSSVKLRGSCVAMTLSGSGGANCDGSEFQTDRFIADLSGGSRCEITVNDRIDGASLSGGSRLSYRGTRIVNNVNVSGGSELINKNLLLSGEKSDIPCKYYITNKLLRF